MNTLFTRLRNCSESRPAPQVPDGVRVYAVGDIHGRSDLLDGLHIRIREDLMAQPSHQTIIVYLGDYIDRGSDSPGVLQRLCGPAIEGTERILLKGNHEQMLERFLATPETGTMWRQLGGTETLLSYGVDVKSAFGKGGLAHMAAQLREKIPQAHRQLMASLQVSTTIGDYFFCHAGARPKIPLDRQDPADLLWIRNEFLASDYAFEKTIVHGHSPVEDAEFHEYRINIDTGAYATGRLTCLVLSSKEQRLICARL